MPCKIKHNINFMKAKNLFLKTAKIPLYMGFSAALFFPAFSQAQNGYINVANANPYTQDFSGMTGNTLPSGFVAQNSSNGYVNAVTQSPSGSGTSGSYNTGAPYKFTNTGTSNISIGYLGSGSFSAPKELKATLQNNSGGVITQLVITYKPMQFSKSGRSNSWQFYGGGNLLETVPFAGTGSGSAATYGWPLADSPVRTFTITTNINPNETYDFVWKYVDVSGSGSRSALGIDDITITPTIQTCSSPSAASSINIANVTDANADISWTNGDGEQRLAFIKQTNDITDTVPVDDGTDIATLTANATFGLGTQAGTSGWYCIYKGATGSSLTVDGLAGLTTYSVRVVEYNACSGAHKYTRVAASASEPDTFITTQSGDIFNVATDDSSFCNSAANDVSVSFETTLSSGDYDAELSDENGDFTSPTIIGTGSESPITATIPFPINPGENYQIRVVNHTGGDFISGNTAGPIVISSPPEFASFLEGSTICEGASLNLSMEALTTSYQWLKNNTPIDGATSYEYNIANTTQSDAGEYAVIIANGACSDTSTTATITINPVQIPEATATSNSTQGADTTINYTTGTDCEMVASLTTVNSDLGSVNANVTVNASQQVNGAGDWYVGRVYEITPTTQPTDSVNVSLYYNSFDFDDYNANVTPDKQIDYDETAGTLSNFNISQFHGTDAIGSQLEDMLVPESVSFNGTFWTVSFHVNSFSTFVGSGQSTVLPIDLKNISAKNAGKENIINWETANEHEGEYFVLQRSADGRTFENMVAIQGKGTAASYHQVDNAPLSGVNYYRLYLPNNQNGKYSPVVTATLNADNIFSVSAYPNPAKNNAQIKIVGMLQADATLQFLDVTGKVVKTVAVKNNSMQVDLSELPMGVYTLKYQDSLHTTISKLVVTR